MIRARIFAALLLVGRGTVRECAAVEPVPHAARIELEKDIARLEAKIHASLPEFESEQHAWEAEVLQAAAARSKTAPPQVPPRIRAILALEPTEREPAQREELAAYFRPRSKTLGDLTRQLAAKRATLARISR
ncbi:MAG: hypothetical protein K8R23_00510 [Chthoniobacter sp.]|nr:hypothetical protein [Chthoniobacter sp.]